MFDRYCELAPDNDDIDDAVYDVICEWDEQFAGDTTWCNDEETDVKDRLRDEVLEMLGENWDCPSEEEEIVFCCEGCNRAIIRDSKEHDLCNTRDGEIWYCMDCKLPSEKEEEEEEEDEEEETIVHMHGGVRADGSKWFEVSKLQKYKED